MDAPQKPSIFLSHTSSDAEVAHAISAALELLFGAGTVDVNYSTRKDPGGGIQAGADWFVWITEQVRKARVTLVVLTPASVQKPWILWETGAVYGAAAAENATDLRRVRPVTFGIRNEDVPGPLASMRLQNINGDSREDVRSLLSGLAAELGSGLSAERMLLMGRGVDDAVERWLEGTADAMRLTPLLPTEPVIQEWLSRLAELSEGGRASEVDYLHQWINVAFGREREGDERPLDVRLHRRLGDLYSASSRHPEAAGQYLLAHKLAPRDIYTLRFLGKAYLDAQNVDAARAVVADIDRLDPDAAVRNPQCAALKGRWLVACDRKEDARDVYRAALRENPHSYYLADLLGQVLLLLEDGDGAKEVYRRAHAIIDELEESNVWTHSTATTAAVVLDDEPAVKRHLAAIRGFEPTQGELETIERGLRTLQEQLNLPVEKFFMWSGWLRAAEPQGAEGDLDRASA